MQIFSGSRVLFVDNPWTPYPYSQGGGLFDHKYNQNNLSQRNSENATSPTANPLKIWGSHKIPFHTFILLILRKLHENHINPPRYWQCPPPPSILPPYSFRKDFQPMPDNIGKSHRICEYIRCSPEEFSTWVEAAILFNPSTPPSTSIPLTPSIVCIN